VYIEIRRDINLLLKLHRGISALLNAKYIGNIVQEGFSFAKEELERKL